MLYRGGTFEKKIFIIIIDFTVHYFYGNLFINYLVKIHMSVYNLFLLPTLKKKKMFSTENNFYLFDFQLFF